MKVLFICKWNVGRSQIAEELFNKYTKEHMAISAGTHAIRFKDQKLKDFAYEVVKVMQEKDVDVGNKTPSQLSPELAKSSDRIIVLTDKSDLPVYIADSEKLVFWKIEDGGGRDYEFHVNMRNQIDFLVKKLLEKIK